MALELTKDKALIFRITHRDNVPWILDNRMHARNGEKFDPKCRNIGNLELIDKRSRRVVPVQPGAPKERTKHTVERDHDFWNCRIA